MHYKMLSFYAVFYMTGGCCLSCGSIYHFKRDCPELKVNKG